MKIHELFQLGSTVGFAGLFCYTYYLTRAVSSPTSDPVKAVLGAELSSCPVVQLSSCPSFDRDSFVIVFYSGSSSVKSLTNPAGPWVLDTESHNCRLKVCSLYLLYSEVFLTSLGYECTPACMGEDNILAVDNVSLTVKIWQRCDHVFLSRNKSLSINPFFYHNFT